MDTREPVRIEGLVRQYANYVYGVAFNRLGNFHDAQDVAQEVFIKAYLNLGKLKDEAKLASWLYTMADRTAIDWLRKRRTHANIDDMPSLQADPVALESQVWGILDGLSEGNRLTTILHYLGGYTAQEIGGFLGVSADAVKQRLHRVRKSLRRGMFDMLEGTMGGKGLGEEFVRRVIAGVNRVDWSDSTKQNEFALCVVSALRHLGEEVGYQRVVALSGACFKTFLTPDPVNPANHHTAYAPEIVDHAFRMLGYGVTRHARGDFDTDRKRIMASIDAGVPVLTLDGVVNCSDCCIITGYDGDGEVLMGWSTFQDIPEDHSEPHDEKTGYFRKTGWHAAWDPANDAPYCIIGGHVEKPAYPETIRSTLALGARLIRGGSDAAGYKGQAAHARYIECLRDDAFWSALGDDGFFGAYIGILCNYKTYLDKKEVVPFLTEAVDALSDHRDPLMAALHCYSRIANMVDGLGAIVPQDFSEASMAAVRGSETRAEYAGIIGGIRDLELEAAEYFEAVVG